MSAKNELLQEQWQQILVKLMQIHLDAATKLLENPEMVSETYIANEVNIVALESKDSYVYDNKDFIEKFTPKFDAIQEALLQATTAKKCEKIRQELFMLYAAIIGLGHWHIITFR